MANQLGKRYTCAECGSSVLCTKTGEGVINCCDSEMEIQEPRKLPSSDQPADTNDLPFSPGYVQPEPLELKLPELIKAAVTAQSDQGRGHRASPPTGLDIHGNAEQMLANFLPHQVRRGQCM